MNLFIRQNTSYIMASPRLVHYGLFWIQAVSQHRNSIWTTTLAIWDSVLFLLVYIYLHLFFKWGSPGGSGVKNLPVNAGDE